MLAAFADCVKVVSLPACYFAAFGSPLMANISFVFLMCVGFAGAAIGAMEKLRVISVRCPDCNSPMSLNPPLSECPNCRVAFWKNVFFFGYTRIPEDT